MRELQVCVSSACQEEDLLSFSHELKLVRAEEVTIYAESGDKTIVDALVEAVLENHHVDKVHFIGVQFSSSFLYRLNEQFSVVWVEHCIVGPPPR